MTANLINLSSAQNFVQGLILIVLSTWMAGVAGLLTVFLMFWMTNQKFATDSHEKHGISHQQASRLGGVAVAFCAACIYWLSVGIQLPVERVGEALFSNLISYALLIGLIGFCDDVFGHIQAKTRIVLTTLIFAACLIINPGYIPSDIGIPLIDTLLNYWPIAFVLCLVACVGMLNATNMADGANGLMPLVFMGSFYGFFLISGELVYFALTMGLMVFTLFNILSGKLFLGDTGTYGLGALAALGAIQIMSETEAEAWFFLCLAAYPVTDFFISIARRKAAGRSPFSADNDHMHNRLYRYLQKFIPSRLMANSLSGLFISLSTTGIALTFLFFWSTESKNWIVLFASQVIVYMIVFYRLGADKYAVQT